MAEALTFNKELTIGDVQQILDKRTVYPVIKSLINKEVIFVTEDIKDRYKPKTVAHIRLTERYSVKQALKQLFDELERAPRQLELLMSYIHLSTQKKTVTKPELIKSINGDAGLVKRLVVTK